MRWNCGAFFEWIYWTNQIDKKLFDFWLSGDTYEKLIRLGGGNHAEINEFYDFRQLNFTISLQKVLQIMPPPTFSTILIITHLLGHAHSKISIKNEIFMQKIFTSFTKKSHHLKPRPHFLHSISFWLLSNWNIRDYLEEEKNDKSYD